MSRLQTTINDYRQHRIEAERENASRAERREKRDQIIFEKMSLLSEQLEGGARRMLRREITEMRRALSAGNDEQKENVSIELMSRAFSTMSDEVANLIEARTHELVAARDEIGSSIRYAAKLQNALLPSALPTEMEMEVWWRLEILSVATFTSLRSTRKKFISQLLIVLAMAYPERFVHHRSRPFRKRYRGRVRADCRRVFIEGESRIESHTYQD